MAPPQLDPETTSALQQGLLIPACPLALTANRKLDERRQRALLRCYHDAGAGGAAIGVHATQFAIRDPQHDLLAPVLRLAIEEMRQLRARDGRRLVAIAGVCGPTPQAVAEAKLAASLGYDAVLLSLAALKAESISELIAHCRAVAGVVPVFGFYLQPAVGGRVLPFEFWTRFAELDNVVAIKIAPFNRYQTLDVVRAVVEAGRDDIALYTGNDDAIVSDLLTPFRLRRGGQLVERRIVGGLLGQWAVWTHAAARLFAECRRIARSGAEVPAALISQGVELTDANAALFDAANGFAGCIAGLHEVLRRQGLLESTVLLDPNEQLSPGQAAEIDRVTASYPQLTDDAFVREHLDRWLAG